MKILHLSIISLLLCVITSSVVVHAQTPRDTIDLNSTDNLTSFSASIMNITQTSWSALSSVDNNDMTVKIEYHIIVKPKPFEELTVDIFKNNKFFRTDTLTDRNIVLLATGNSYYLYQPSLVGKKDQDVYRLDFKYDGQNVSKTIPISSTPNGIVYPVKIESPVQQLKSGIKAEDVKCASDLILTVNRHYSPACVKETSAIELLLRGWSIGFAHYEAVFFMKPHSTSQIAVNYFPNHYEGSSPPDMIMNLYSRVYKPNSSFPTNEINTTAKPHFIHTSSDTVVNYTITSPDTKGIYWLSLSDSCNLIPIVIDIDPSFLTLSDLQNPANTHSCPPPETQFHVASISNISLKLIRID